MTEAPKPSRPVFACRFVGPDDEDPRNSILFWEPKTIQEWVASLNRCNEIVESHLDDLERSIAPIKRL
ncbi:MAG: hypothetical protein ABL893_16645 [Hyphomicrobium sp.]|nr:hypothetical protein [Hyphomicrobium sp.]